MYVYRQAMGHAEECMLWVLEGLEVLDESHNLYISQNFAVPILSQIEGHVS